MAGPLEGIRVVEMGVWVAGPSCAAILADWGAEVVKLEPPEGDPFRGLGAAFCMAMNPPFELDNRGKRSVAVNLETPEGRAIAGALIERADVFVTNMRPRALERLGMTYEELSARNPGLIYCAVSGYGRTGPYADKGGFDLIAQGFAGLMSMLGGFPLGISDVARLGRFSMFLPAPLISSGLLIWLLVSSGRGGRPEETEAAEL
ncbi:MAG: CoA transferase [Dehalococcoidia bacterium]|nr:CoA transferase [Dehalococcoidia bacterium]